MILCLIPSNYVRMLFPFPLLNKFLISRLQLSCLTILTRRVDINPGLEEAAIEVILEGLAREIHAAVGVRMHRLGVFEWEVKLWMASCGQANGAWRLVVTNVTGHTCTVHVSLAYESIQLFNL